MNSFLDAIRRRRHQKVNPSEMMDEETLMQELAEGDLSDTDIALAEDELSGGDDEDEMIPIDQKSDELAPERMPSYDIKRSRQAEMAYQDMGGDQGDAESPEALKKMFDERDLDRPGFMGAAARKMKEKLEKMRG